MAALDLALARARRVLYVSAALALCTSACARPPMNDDAFASPDTAPLAAAVARGDGAEVRRLLAGRDPDARGRDDATLLVQAIVDGQRDSALALLDAGADPNLPAQGGETPVHAAAFARDPALLALVLGRGGDPDIANPATGATPLMAAILGAGADQVRMLLDAGADPAIADRLGDTPLHVAARSNDGASLLLLLQRGAPPLADNRRGRSFQDFYFATPREVLDARGLQERRAVVAWLKANDVPLAVGVEAAD